MDANDLNNTPCYTDVSLYVVWRIQPPWVTYSQGAFPNMLLLVLLFTHANHLGSKSNYRPYLFIRTITIWKKRLNVVKYIDDVECR